MELIPILATIILVATISTFFLSIGAYILYKVREAKGARAKAVIPATIQAELVTPEGQMEQIHAGEPYRISSAAPVYEQQPLNYIPREPAMARQQSNPAPFQARVSSAAQQFVPNRQEGPQSPGRYTDGGRKFVKVTSESQEKPKEQAKNPGALKWR